MTVLDDVHASGDRSMLDFATNDYRFAVGTAGSTMLVLQTVLPALLRADGRSTIELSGGTHNPFAPPFDFLARAFLPQLARMGAKVEAELVRPGFYPAGGGIARVTIESCASLAPLSSIRCALLAPVSSIRCGARYMAATSSGSRLLSHELMFASITMASRRSGNRVLLARNPLYEPE